MGKKKRYLKSYPLTIFLTFNANSTAIRILFNQYIRITGVIRYSHSAAVGDIYIITKPSFSVPAFQFVENRNKVNQDTSCISVLSIGNLPVSRLPKQLRLRNILQPLEYTNQIIIGSTYAGSASISFNYIMP